jgi:hypothetical protein
MEGVNDENTTGLVDGAVELPLVALIMTKGCPAVTLVGAGAKMIAWLACPTANVRKIGVAAK